MTASQSNRPEPIDQASAIPYRRHDGKLEFCLITSIKRGRWMFPKGIIDPGETYVETALKEAEEEAGLHGSIVGEPLGTYEYHKWGTTLYVKVTLMSVSHADEQWPEADVRQRRWVDAEQARKLLDQAELRELLDKALRRLQEGAE